MRNPATLAPMTNANVLGTDSIGKLLIKQSVPAAIGFLVMSINSIVDTIFVGHFVGATAIAAIAVVMPISFFISSIGLAIGIGGGSIISRALGERNHVKANKTFGTQIFLTLGMSFLLLGVGYLFRVEVLDLFGGKGAILEPATTYFDVVLFGTPFLAWAMMSNNVVRAEGKPKVAMMVMISAAILNVILDPILIIYLDMGLFGAAIATTFSFVASATYVLIYFLRGKSVLKLQLGYLRPNGAIATEIFKIGGVSLARQGSVTLLIIVLNQSLYRFGGEMAVAVYGIINRLMMFSLFPVMGVVQGYMPIVGFNFGAKSYDRVIKTVKTAVLYGTGLATLVFGAVIIFPEMFIKSFSRDADLIRIAPHALRVVFFALPLITMQLIGSSYFQAIGKAGPALLLTLTKQGFFLIPLVLILPNFFQLDGIWYAFPVADILSTLITVLFLNKALKRLVKI